MTDDGERSTVNDPWSLIIAGDGEAGYRRELERVAAEAGVGERVRFVGQVVGEEKARLLAGAECVVLASHSENFGMSVAEALAHGTPALWPGEVCRGKGSAAKAAAFGWRIPKRRWPMACGG